MTALEKTKELLYMAQFQVIQHSEAQLQQIEADYANKEQAIHSQRQSMEKKATDDATTAFNSSKRTDEARRNEINRMLSDVRNRLQTSIDALEKHLLEQKISHLPSSSAMTGLPDQSLPSKLSVNASTMSALFEQIETSLKSFAAVVSRSTTIKRYSVLPVIILIFVVLGVFIVCGVTAICNLFPDYATPGWIAAIIALPLLPGLSLAGVLRLRAKRPYSQLRKAQAQAQIETRHIQELLDKVPSKLDLESKAAESTREKARRASLDEIQRRIDLAQQDLSAAKQLHDSGLDSLHDSVVHTLNEVNSAIKALERETQFASASWDYPSWNSWMPATETAEAIKIGSFQCSSDALAKRWPDLPLPIQVPAFISLQNEKGILLEVSAATKSQAIGSVQSLCFRLLANVPPGRVKFTFIDPVGLGNNVASLMSLKEHDDTLVTSRAWSESRQIADRLTGLTEQMEEIIQHKLQDKYPNIYEYNKKAPVIEPYRFLVVFDFPTNFTDDTIRRLVSIAQNGPRCGVHVMVVYDVSKPMPYGADIADLERCALVIRSDTQGQSGLGFRFQDEAYEKWTVGLDSPPQKELGDCIKEGVGKLAKSGSKVEIPYPSLLEMAKISHIWAENTLDGIEVPLGPRTTTQPQTLVFGKGTAHHGLIAGRTGSGKSNLMHVIITTLALKYSPDELQLYLIDFKQGVEFKCYATEKLPQAYTIAIETEREFALSVMERLERELGDRGTKFRSEGATNLGEYRRKTGLVVPRILLLVDEFQEFFREDDELSRRVSAILNQLVLQGRSYGIHLLMGTQSLANARGLTRGTSDQIGVRIALQCSEADSRLILADDNPAARLLARPGEAIYNDKSGLFEGNALFQVASMTESEREHYLAIYRYSQYDYTNMNTALRSQDPEEEARWGPQSRIAASGLSKLPIFDGMVFRGVGIEIDPAAYVTGSVVTETGFTSSSRIPKASVGSPLQFEIQSRNGRDISSCSAMQSDAAREQEILFVPNTRFEVTANFMRDGVTVVQMKEV